MWRRIAATVTVLLLAGCTAVPAASPSTPAAPASTRLTAQVLGALIEEHFGVAYAVTGTDAGQVAVQPTVWVAGIAATAYYRATPGEAELAITVGYSAAPLPSDFTCPPKTCTVQGNIYVRDPEVGASDVISLRDAGFVQVTVADGALPDASLPTAVALASDPRIAVLTDAALAASAATNPRWRTDDLGCGDSTATGLIPLPAADGDGAVEPPTAQGLAAVIASRVATGCVGGSGLEAIAYLGADTERVSLAVTEAELGCEGLDECETRGDVTIGWQFDVPEEHTAMVRLIRPAGDGQHWVAVEHNSLQANPSDHSFPIPLDTLLGLVSDDRVGAEVDRALNRAGDELPLRWRLTRHTAD